MIEIVFSIVSLIISLVAVGFGYYSFRKTHKTSVQPMLAFFNQGKDDTGKTQWYVENVGKGVALNVLIASGNTKLNWNKDKIVLLSAIPCGDRKRLGWIGSTGALLATYSDVYGGEYTSICVGNRNRLSQGNSYRELEPSRFQYQLEKKQMTEL